MAFFSVICCGGDRKEKEKQQPTWRIFSLKELHSATNNFNYDNKLGEGGFGSVYWGQLWDGSQIAVKRLKEWSNKAEVQFSVEVEILARVRHKNLLSLRGYCAEGQERLIVYDYMPNLSLLSHLHGFHSAEGLLDWTRRMNIAIGSAEGIAYLHHHSTPHLASGKKPLEKVSAKSKRPIAEWALPLASEGKFSELVDPRLNGKYVEEEFKRVVLVALVCADNRPEKRPTMLEVVELLKGESKQKLSELENNEVFKSPQLVVCNGETSGTEESSDVIKEEKDPEPVTEKEMGQDSPQDG
ncbi:hypothetical protein GQ457_07G032340 [Hibiscus cannabinus]